MSQCVLLTKRDLDSSPQELFPQFGPEHTRRCAKKFGETPCTSFVLCDTDIVNRSAKDNINNIDTLNHSVMIISDINANKSIYSASI